MPLKHGKSKAAFEYNVRAEVAAGKPVKQAVAIAYSEKRAASDAAMTLMSGKYIKGSERSKAKPSC